MRITLVPSSVFTSHEEQDQFLTSYLVNDSVAVDAGALGLYRPAGEQACVQHVFLTHTHMDHLASLPVFVESVYEAQRDCVTVHGSADVLDCLRQDIFNDRVWPDFLRLSAGSDRPFLKLAALEPGRPVEVEGLRLTPVPVNHVVPTLGLVIEDAASAVVLVSDTGPTEEIWARANATPNLRAVFLEAAFPNAMAQLAEMAKHLTPDLFAAEVRKLSRPAKVIVVHIKSRYRAEVTRELAALGLPNVEIGRFGRPYVF